MKRVHSDVNIEDYREIKKKKKIVETWMDGYLGW